MWRKASAVLIGTILAGGLIGWKSVETKISAPAGTSAAISRPASHQVRWSNGDFLDFVRRRNLEKVYPNPLAGKLADWTSGEITDALNASLTDPACILHNGAGEGLANFLLAEWMRRDFDAALAWFDQLEPRSVKSSLIQKIGNLWPADKSEEGLAFVRANLSLSSGSDQILVNILGSRARQGAGAVEDLLKIMREEKIHFDVSQPIDFPADFDFSALAESEEFQTLWDRQGCTMFMRGWFGQDKDAAYDWLLENHGVESLSSNMLMPPDGNYQGYFKWMGGRIESLDPARRVEYVDHNRQDWLKFPDRLPSLADNITDPVLLGELRTIGVQSLHGGNAVSVVPLLEGIDDPARRIEMLETTPPPDMDRTFLSRGFTSGDEALLRRALVEWNAAPERIEAIIARFKK